MIISSQRTPKCAHLDSSLRRQKTNKISPVPVVHIKARNVSARGSFQFSSSGKKCKKAERVLSFFFVLFISGVSSSEQPDWRSFFSLTLMLANAGHSSQCSLSVLQISKSFTSWRYSTTPNPFNRRLQKPFASLTNGKRRTDSDSPPTRWVCDNRITRASLTALWFTLTSSPRRWILSCWQTISFQIAFQRTERLETLLFWYCLGINVPCLFFKGFCCSVWSNFWWWRNLIHLKNSVLWN